MLLGPIDLAVPIVLAPMAGVTNSAYRQLCREQAEKGAGGLRPAGLFTCEMVTAAAVAWRIPKSLAMLRPDPGDPIRSVQLYGVEPATVARAVTVCAELGVTHVDLNFGCPVPKVTRKGGGGVLPWKLDRFAAILEAAVGAAAPYGIPVTLKTRLGIDAAHETMLDAGRIAGDVGLAAITLHARTVAQAYAGQADWRRIRELVEAVTIPVIGNGDVWEAADARRMLAETGCAGVMIGRGCLGRPWLFRDLAAELGPSRPLAPAPYDVTLARGPGLTTQDEMAKMVTAGHDVTLACGPGPTRALAVSGVRAPAGPSDADVTLLAGAGAGVTTASAGTGVTAPGGPRQADPGSGVTTVRDRGGVDARAAADSAHPTTARPTLGEVVAMVHRHAELLVAHFGDEAHALADLRKHMTWYFKGFPLGGDLRLALGLVTSVAEFDRLTEGLDPTLPYPADAQAAPRGRQGTPRAKVTMPHGWLDSRTLDGPLEDPIEVAAGG